LPNFRGFFTMKNSTLKRPVRRRLSSAIGLAVLVSFGGGAFAQDSEGAEQRAAPDQQDSAPTTLDSVTVVGSRIKRAEIEGPAPVTVISRADIDREGFQNVADMLQTLSQNTSSSFT